MKENPYFLTLNCGAIDSGGDWGIFVYLNQPKIENKVIKYFQDRSEKTWFEELDKTKQEKALDPQNYKEIKYISKVINAYKKKGKRQCLLALMNQWNVLH